MQNVSVQNMEENPSATHYALAFLRCLALFSFSVQIMIYHIHTEIYTLKSRRVNFRSQTDVNQSNLPKKSNQMKETRQEVQ